MSATQKYTAAVVGVGKPKQPFKKGGGHAIGHIHARMFLRSPRVDLIAGADIASENLAYYQNEFNVPQGFKNYNELFREAKPDIISIGTYCGLHLPIIEAAARAGVKGIICEKPFLNSPADIDPVRRIVAETGVKICVAHIRRYNPTMQRCRQLLRDGVIGQVITYFSGVEGWDLSEMASHWFDLIRFFHDDKPVKSVFGQARVRELRGYGHAMEDHAIAYFEFEDGARGIIDGGRGLPNGINFIISGTAGTIRVMGEHTVVVDTIAGQRIEPCSHLRPDGWSNLGIADSPDWLPTWDMMLADLMRWIEGGPAPMMAMDNALKTFEVNQAAYISSIRGDRVDLPFDAAAVAINDYPVEILARRK